MNEMTKQSKGAVPESDCFAAARKDAVALFASVFITGELRK